MIICRYNGEIHCISEAEDFRELVAPEVFDALYEFLKIKEHTADEFVDLERECDRLYDELEDAKSELEDAQEESDCLEEDNDALRDKLSDISKTLKKLLSDKDFGYINQDEFINKIKELSDNYAIIK